MHGREDTAIYNGPRGSTSRVGGRCLGKTNDLSQTRTAVPIADRQSVQCVPVMVCALGHIEPEGTHQERRQKTILMKRNRYHSANILPFGVPAHAEPRRDGVTAVFGSTTRRLLALPRPWRSRAPHFCILGSSTIAVAHSIMHHDMSRRRIDALRLGCCSEPQP